MLKHWGLPVAEVVRGLVGKGPYGGDIDDGGGEIDEGDEVEVIDEVDESEIDTGNGTTDSVISAA